MQSHHLHLLLLLLLVAVSGSGAAPSAIKKTPVPPPASQLANSLCARARYSPLCVRTLSTSAAKTAAGLTRAAIHAAFRSTLLLRRSSSTIAPDCASLLADAAAKLAGTEAAIARISAAAVGSKSKLDDCQTWMSAAMTDADMCLAMIGSGHAAVAKRVSEVSMLTSNALYLISRLAAGASRHH